MPEVSYVYPNLSQVYLKSKTMRGGLSERWILAQETGCEYIELPGTLIKNKTARAGTRRMMKELEKYSESKVEPPLIRHGKKQKVETLTNEEALLFAKLLQGEKRDWKPRILIVL